MAMRRDRPFGPAGPLGLLLAAALVPAGAAGQEPVIPLQLSLSDPGARSMGLGGAFVALADDATAALANPAGLVQLVDPEVSVEGRRWSYSTPFTVGGRAEGLPSGLGIDTIAGLRTDRSRNTIDGISFLSVAYPKGKGTVALFRHQLANFEFASETQGLFGGTECCQIRFFGQRAMARLDLVSYGISAAYRVHERLALGLGALYHEASLAAEATMYLPDDWPEGGAAGLFSPTSFSPERSLLRQRSFFDGTDWALSAGFLWWLAPGWTVGGVYRQGPEADFGVELTAGQAGDFGVPPGGVLTRITGVGIELPGLAGLGFAYRAPADRLTLSFQWDRVDYSTIVTSLGLDDVAVDDADELHLGGEYVFLGSTPVLAVRLGAWLDPDHQLRHTGDDPFVLALEPRGRDEIHLTAGLGVAYRRFQIDLGVDLADWQDAVSISAVYGF